jgi:3-polyprenyl-4-hydroxybenzoate decarboxylase
MVDVAELPAGVNNYKGMREWLDAVQSIGELRRVTGATWQEDIGRISEMLTHTDGAPAVICDEIPGYPKGFRVLLNSNGERERLAITLGLDPNIGTEELMTWFETRMDSMKPIPVKYVTDAPIL